MNEKSIQDALFDFAYEKKQRLITPNVRLYGKKESDLITVSNAGLITEYEIKISRADFLADFRRKRSKHIYLKEASIFKSWAPNYFYFVVPADLAPSIQKDIPSYAGLVVVSGTQVCISKISKRLHNLKSNKRNIEYLSRGLMIRYWSSRGCKC